MFSWLTGSGVLKEDDFEDDQDKLVEFYQNKGYIDFAIKDIQYDHPSPKWMVIRIIVSEGKQYKVGTLDIKGNHIFSTNDLINGVQDGPQVDEAETDAGRHFKPADFNDDVDTIRDMYGAKGYLEREQGGTTVITANHAANPDDRDDRRFLRHRGGREVLHRENQHQGQRQDQGQGAAPRTGRLSRRSL